MMAIGNDYRIIFILSCTPNKKQPATNNRKSDPLNKSLLIECDTDSFNRGPFQSGLTLVCAIHLRYLH